MATFDQLSAEQRAIIELVLKQGQSYDQLGDMLGLPTSRVRSMAREALVRLSPVSAAAVEADWRDQIADYLLNQQNGPESTATRGHLRRSEAARGWARSVEDSLEHLYRDGDSAGDPWPATRPTPGLASASRGESASRGRAATSRPRPAARSCAGGSSPGRGWRWWLCAVLVWPISVFSGDDDDDGGSSANQQARIVGQVELRPTAATRGTNTAGGGVIVETGGKLELIVQAQLPPSRRNQAYEVWLYNSPRNARSLGGKVTNRQGLLQGRAELPGNFTRYSYIDISRERVDGNAGHSGTSVLRERISRIQAPPATGQGTTPQGQGTAPEGQGTTPSP